MFLEGDNFLDRESLFIGCCPPHKHLALFVCSEHYSFSYNSHNCDLLCQFAAHVPGLVPDAALRLWMQEAA